MTPEAQKDLLSLGRKVLLEVSRSETLGNGFSILGDQGYKNGAWIPYNPLSILRHALKRSFGDKKHGTWMRIEVGYSGLVTASFGHYEDQFSGEHANEHVACALALAESMDVEED